MSKFLKDNALVVVLVLVLCGAVTYMVWQQQENDATPTTTVEDVAMEEAITVTEGFENHSPADDTQSGSGGDNVNDASVNPAEDEQDSQPGPVEGAEENVNQLPSECYPKDVLNSADLLPRDANSLHAQVVPSGQGALGDQNFLTAGYHLGVNTVGQTLRNANRQLRSDPPNAQVKVSPWNQTTIEPDVNRRPLEIGGQ